MEENAKTFAGRLFSIGGGAFSLFVPVLAGYISYSIADPPGLAPGFIGGFPAARPTTTTANDGLGRVSGPGASHPSDERT